MKKVLLTGGSKGLGLEINNMFLSQGIEVTSLSRSKPNNNSQHISVDFLDNTSVHLAIKKVLKNFNDFDTLILCAGGGEIEEIGEINEQSIEETMALNLNSNIIIANMLLEKIKENGADIVVIGATIGYKANKFMPVYSIAKWGLRGFVENIREACKESKSRVIHVVPGGLDTESNVGPTGRETIISKKTGKEIHSLINPREVSELIGNFLSLSKDIEISEVIINRK